MSVRPTHKRQSVFKRYGVGLLALAIFAAVVGGVVVTNVIASSHGVITFTKDIVVNGLIESTASGFKFPDGTTQTTAASGDGVDRQVFTADGTWNKPSSGTVALIELWGGGGGGASNGEAGGGGGEYVRVALPLSSLGSSETVTVGAGGSPESNGGSSSFGSHATAQPGTGGSGTSPGVGGGIGGGIASGQSTREAGAAGGGSNSDGGDSVYGGGGGGGTDNAGDGGVSQFGGNGGNGNDSDDAADGSAPGGGGGASDNGTGGSGARGEVRVTVW